MATAKVTSKGQITIPLRVRRLLNLEEGDRVDFVVDESGDVRLRRLGGSISELRGMLAHPERRAVSLREMEQSIVDVVADDDQRTRDRQ